MKRRDFIKNMGMAAVGAPLLLSDFQVQAMSSFLNIDSAAEGRVLVLIRLNGGNDGLNTVIPIDQYANLVIQRNNVIIPESSILSVTDDIGFHPNMGGMQNMFNSGTLGIIQNVGYPEQNRSHFRSMDIWSSGLIDAPATTGWMGRKLQTDYPTFPEDYPNTNNPHPFAISMGNGVSSTCQGTKSNFSHTVNDPTEVFNLGQGDFIHDGSCHSEHLEYINLLINQTNEYGAEINDAASAGNTISAQYDNENELAVHLRNVAKLISGGLETKIYVLNVNGFDTHATQVDIGDSTTGDHADLMKTVSDAISAFQDDLKLLGIEDRVLGMSFSEFGRQIASNASYGTDHGDAAPLFLFGSCLDFTVKGNNPTVSDTITNQAGVPMETDFRDVYASVLKDWFGIPTSEIQPLFEHTITYQDIIKYKISAIGDEQNTNEQTLIYPNPAYNNTTVRFNSDSEWVKVSVLDLNGEELMTPVDKQLRAGLHDLPFNVSDLKRGQYILRIQKSSGQIESKLQKM